MKKDKMTTEKAIHILMNIGDYVEYIEGIGICLRSPLVDASLLAIKALQNSKAEATASTDCLQSNDPAQL